jgi:hypothetical protein
VNSVMPAMAAVMLALVFFSIVAGNITWSPNAVLKHRPPGVRSPGRNYPRSGGPRRRESRPGAISDPWNGTGGLALASCAESRRAPE